jgi:hypothetical protein
MNIFVLDPNPTIAASYHCDQHLHKMILESAQLISTALAYSTEGPSLGLYRPTHPNHPCTTWARRSVANMAWIVKLATELDNIRQSLSNCGSHASMEIIKIARDYLSDRYHLSFDHTLHTPFIFAGPAIISIRPGSTIDHYQQYYRRKHNTWLVDKGTGMAYKGRTVPSFMADLISPII